MKLDLANYIIDKLPKDRTLFYYFKDRYAVLLLNDFLCNVGTPEEAGEGEKEISQIKSSRYSKLLQRPILADLIGRKGAGHLNTADLETCWPIDPVCYRLTLGVWGDESQNYLPGYFQTTRRGVNLVLQLNFSNEHDSHYARLIDPEDVQPFSYAEHPIARPGFHTLAWARIDLNMTTGEALIEELQSDWVRYVKWSAARFAQDIADKPHPDDNEMLSYGGVILTLKHFKTYLNKVILPHMSLWDEAILSATIWFLRHELGIYQIYCHDFETGNRLKAIADKLPPRSLYTKLPKKFCFGTVGNAPHFLTHRPTKALKTMTKAGTLRFWKLPNIRME